MGWSNFFTGEVKVINIYGEFKIGVKNFIASLEAEDGNICDVEVIANPPADPEAAIAPPEAGGIENQEAWASIFDAAMNIQPGRVTLAPDDLVDL